MGFGLTPLSTTALSTNQFPVSAVAEPGRPNGDLTALEGGPGSVDSNGNRTAPVSTYVKDGGNIAQGLTTDSAVTGDNPGTLSAKMRGFVKILTDVWDSVNHRLQVEQSDATGTGTITAAQPTEDTPVANATVAITLGKGQTSWAVDLRGTFSAGTTINFDGTLNGTNWFSVNGVPLGSTSDTEVSSVVGGSPLQYQGNASGLQQVRVRASVLQVSDSVTATLIGSISSDGGFLSKALPPGTASIGSVTANAGTNLNTSLLALESGGNLAAAKTDLDTIVTNTNKIPASPAQEGGHLATIDASTAPGVQGWIAASGTGTASQDDAITFANQVRKVYLYNASANPVPFEFDQTSAATSVPLQPGQGLIVDGIFCTVVHVFPSATLPINTTAGLYVKGWK